MSTLRNAKNAIKSLLFRFPGGIQLMYPKVELCHPLDGFVGHFPQSFSRKPPEVHSVNQVVEYISLHHTCFDVGANIGYYSLLFAKYGGQVISFEPAATNFAILRRNIAMNRVGDRVLTYRKAVGRGGGEVKIYIQQPGIDVRASIIDKSPSFERVDQVCLDDFCRENSVWPDICKIDVEGYESDVIMGMEEILATVKPILFLEVNPERGGYNHDIVWNLTQIGYKVFSWAEDVEPGGYGFWRHLIEVGSCNELRLGFVFALPQDKYSGLASV